MYHLLNTLKFITENLLWKSRDILRLLWSINLLFSDIFSQVCAKFSSKLIISWCTSDVSFDYKYKKFVSILTFFYINKSNDISDFLFFVLFIKPQNSLLIKATKKCFNLFLDKNDKQRKHIRKLIQALLHWPKNEKCHSVSNWFIFLKKYIKQI